MEKVLLSVLSALLGFTFSQTFNLISFLRRPRFRLRHWSYGVGSCYTGDPPETPWEIELGFFLENSGRNPAKNTRVFVSDIRSCKNSEGPLEQTSIELLELKRPVDLIPAKEYVAITLGTIKSDHCSLALNLQTPLNEERLDMIAADTRGMVRFSAKFYVNCDDRNSFEVFKLDFCPDQDEWASSLLEDYTSEYLDSIKRPRT